MRIYQSWKDFPKRDWKWPDFSPEEMACRGTGSLAIDLRSMNMLQNLRKLIGKPLIVNSAYRSPEHNKAVGGADGSYHMKAQAFDIRMDNHDPEAFVKAAIACGFKGIGLYPRQGFIHIDTRDTTARWGKPFPQRIAQNRFAPEPPPEPEKVSQDTEAVSSIVGGGGLIAAGGGILTGVGSLAPHAQLVAIAGLIVVGIALGIIFRKRLRRIAG